MKRLLMVGLIFGIGMAVGILSERFLFHKGDDKDLEFAVTYARYLGTELWGGSQLTYINVKGRKTQDAEIVSKHSYIWALILQDLCLNKIDENRGALKSLDLKWFGKQKSLVNRAYRHFAESTDTSPFPDEAILKRVSDHPLIKGEFPIGKYFKKRLEDSKADSK